MSKWDFFCGDAFDSDNTELELVDPSDDLEDNNTAFDLISWIWPTEKLFTNLPSNSSWLKLFLSRPVLLLATCKVTNKQENFESQINSLTGRKILNLDDHLREFFLWWRSFGGFFIMIWMNALDSWTWTWTWTWTPSGTISGDVSMMTRIKNQGIHINNRPKTKQKLISWSVLHY